jgi:hypothetical protein
VSRRLQTWILTGLIVSCGVLLAYCAFSRAQRPRKVTTSETRGATTSNSKTNLIQVGAKGDFQAALDKAVPGDTIVLAAGATYVGPFVLPKKTGNSFITIQTSRLSELPEGRRVSPDQSPLMPKLVSAGKGAAAVSTASGAHHYQLFGIEIAPSSDTAMIYDLVNLGDGGDTQRSLDVVPHHLVLDRCYIHAFPKQALKRGIALNSAYTDILNSYVAGFKVAGQDSQAIAGWNGPGPFRIVNNYLEAAGENVMFGGAQAAIPNLVPTKIEIKRNHFYKPLQWRKEDPSFSGTTWTVKNLFELKTGREVVLDGNVFENNWAQAQAGFAILFNSIDDTGSWARIEDITFSNNIIRHSGQGFNIRGRDASGARAARITIRNNLFDDINSSKWGGDGRLFQVYEGATDVVIEHNTAIHTSSVITATGQPSSGFVYRNNLSRHNAYGVFGDGGYIGTACLNHYYPGWTFTNNVLAELPSDVSSNQYPPQNYFPRSFASQFMDAAAGNFRLASTSSFKGKATDGKDIGCDFDELEAATSWYTKGTIGPN